MTSVISSVFTGVVRPILDKWIPDADKRLEAEQFFFKQAHEINLGQIEINKIEAQSESLFKSGWRPFVGWACAGSMAYAIVVRDFLNWTLAVITIYTGHELPALPSPDVTMMFELLLALLGFGSFRTYEKLKLK